jgi:uncharacterized membrane protein
MKNKLLNLFYSEGRNQTADLLKGFAVLFMIQVHITEKFLQLKFHEETFGMISLFLGGTPAAPVFMVVMGYFLSTKKNLLYFIERGTVLFLGGILLNIGLNFYFLVLYFQNKIIGKNPFEYIFGVDILPFAGLSLIIIGLLKEIFRDKYYLYLISALFIALVSDFIPALSEDLHPSLKYISSFIYGSTEWSYFPLIPWLFYPLVGYSYKLFSEKVSLKNVKKIIFLGLTVVILFAYKSFYQVVKLEDYYHHGIMLALWNLAFIVVWAFIVSKLEAYFSKNIVLLFIKWIGKNVTAIYVFQWLIIGNLSMIYYDSQNRYQLFLWFSFVLILSSSLTVLYEKNKMKKLPIQTNE